MNKFFKFFYPGERLKRWMFLFLLSFVLFSIGISGILGKGAGRLNTQIIDLNPYFIPIRDFILSSTKLVTVDIIAILIGIVGTYYVIKSFSRHLRALYPSKVDLVKASYDEIKLRKGPKITTLGGGTGLSTFLRGLKLFTSNITAVVTVADDGGSSGRLRKELKMPPPGDIRNCMVALADSSTLLSKVFQYRFSLKEKDLHGHSFGNLFIGAMSEITGSFKKGIQEASSILSIRGSVVPVTLEDITLEAKLKNRSTIRGQYKISHSKYPIDRVFIMPRSPAASPEAIKGIKKAEVIVFGPGSLYTSIIPNLLVKEVAREIQNSKARKVYICNIMTQPGETDGLTVSQHIQAIIKHVGTNIIEYAIVNIEEIPTDLLNKYRLKGSYPVYIDEENIKKLNVKLRKEKILSVENNLLRHDSEKLAESVIRMTI